MEVREFADVFDALADTPSKNYGSQRCPVHVHRGRLWDGRNALANRQLLTGEECLALQGYAAISGQNRHPPGMSMST